MRLWVAIVTGGLSIAVGAVLMAADGVRAGVGWSHHAAVSSVPLFLVAIAIAAETIARARTGRHGVLRLVAITAFVAWGIGGLATTPLWAGLCNDLAVVLFAVDAGLAVITDARSVEWANEP